MNDVTLFQGGAPTQLPAHLQGHESAVGASLKGSGGVEGNRISIRGRAWRLIQDGEEVATSGNPEMDLVILAALPETSRTYYDKEYVEGENAKPLCWSTDGFTPDAGTGQQACSTECATCPQNEPGSGKKDQTRACRYSKRIAVCLPTDPSKAYLMSIPATSYFGDKVPDDQPKSLQQYGHFLASRATDPTTIVTRFEFDIAHTQPTLRCTPMRFLEQEEFAGVCALLRDPETEAMLPFQYTAMAQPAAKPAAKEIPGKPPVQAGFQNTETVVQETPVQQVAPTGDAGFGGAAAAPVQEQPVQQVAPTGDAGFGATKAAEPAAVRTTAAATTAEPEVVSTSQAATTAGVGTENVADLLSKWKGKA
jgi:hypothetical protein